MNARIVLLLLVCGIMTAVRTDAQSVWRDRNIYSSQETIRVGDIIVVGINDLQRMRFNLTMKSKSVQDVTSNPDVNITGFLPKIKTDRTADNNDSLAVDSRNNLAMNIASVVTGAQGRNFVIAGVREYVINGVSTRFAVTGLVDPSLVSGGTVRADNVVNFRLDVTTTKRGMGLNLTRPELAPDGKADSTLTEQEKQRIILDYLNRMMEEMTRR